MLKLLTRNKTIWKFLCFTRVPFEEEKLSTVSLRTEDFLLEMPKSRRRGNTASSVSAQHDLPMDLIIHILSRLPVKSLIRFNSVSKSWFSLIQSPYFIKLHLNFAKLNPNPIFSSILSLDKISSYGYEFSICLSLIDALDKPIDMNLPFMRGKACRLLGISNGLLCLMSDDEYSLDIIISNPATGNFRKIPSFELSTWYRDDSFYGFDSNEEGFVLIRIDCSSSSVNVGSFSSSANIWEDVKVNTKLTVFLHTFVQVPVLKDGVFYWDGSCDGAHDVLIFDVFNKVLDEILVPCGHGFELKEFKEQLVLIKIVDREFNVWTLNENDKTWKRLKSIDVSDSIPRYRFVTGLGYTGNGKLVLRCFNYTYSNSKLYLYDMETGDTNSLSDLNVEGIKGMYLFAESLAAV